MTPANTLYTNKRNNAKSNYHHARLADKDGNLVQRGGHTVAWREIGDNLVYAVAVCSDQDLFNKQTGRELCDNRLDSISLSEEGAIQVPREVYNTVFIIDIDMIRELIYEVRGLGMFNQDKAVQILEGIELKDLSYQFCIDVFKYLVDKEAL